RTGVLMIYIVMLGLGYNIFCVIVFPKSADLTPKQLHAIMIPVSMIIGHTSQNIVLDMVMGPNMKAADMRYKEAGVFGRYGDNLSDYSPNLLVYSLLGFVAAILSAIFLFCARPALDDEPKEIDVPLPNTGYAALQDAENPESKA
ncbi:hypothetical protein AAMO2058_001617500, partial [Amorphochlora amoebiformis]